MLDFESFFLLLLWITPTLQSDPIVTKGILCPIKNISMRINLPRFDPHCGISSPVNGNIPLKIKRLRFCPLYTAVNKKLMTTNRPNTTNVLCDEMKRLKTGPRFSLCTEDLFLTLLCKYFFFFFFLTGAKHHERNKWDNWVLWDICSFSLMVILRIEMLALFM